MPRRSGTGGSGCGWGKAHPQYGAVPPGDTRCLAPLALDGEIITKATPDIGLSHRAMQKIAENMRYSQFVPYTDRLDYLAPLANNVAYGKPGCSHILC